MGSLAGQKSANTDHIREDFIRSFFMGFTMPGARMGAKAESTQRGFIAGQEYRKNNPARISETMEGFGYILTEAEGTWIARFEVSSFQPQSMPKQPWWLSHFGDTRSDIPKGAKIPKNGIHIRVIGYLSPRGHFGHWGAYEHEFFATSISKIAGGS